jgi:hypothetical protein
MVKKFGMVWQSNWKASFDVPNYPNYRDDVCFPYRGIKLFWRVK